MDQWIHCLSLVERCRLWCSKDIIRSGIGDLSIIVSVWNYEPYKQHGDMSFEIEGTHTTKTVIWVCRIKTLGFARKNCNLNGTWWNSGYPSFFRLHFVFLSSSSSFSSLLFPLFPFLCVPLSFREVPISWGPGSQKTKNEANIPFHQFSFEFTEFLQNWIVHIFALAAALHTSTEVSGWQFLRFEQHLVRTRVGPSEKVGAKRCRTLSIPSWKAVTD